MPGGKVNNFSGLSRDWVGLKFVYVLPFSWGKRETQKHNSEEMSGKCRDGPGTVPGYSRDNPVKKLLMCFLVYWFFSGPNFLETTTTHTHTKKKSSYLMFYSRWTFRKEREREIYIYIYMYFFFFSVRGRGKGGGVREVARGSVIIESRGG